MFINIEMESDIPIYTQLSNEIIVAIANGSLLAGTPLPSVRSLASDLGINMHTVNKAYHELVKKEIIHIIPKSGAIVAEPAPTELNRKRIALTMKPVLAEAIAIGFTQKEIQLLLTELTSNIKEEIL